MAQRVNPYAWAALSGALLSLAYPPYPLGFLGCVGIVPLWYLCRDVSPREAMRRGMVWGAALHVTTLFWLFSHTAVGGALAFVYMIASAAIFPLFLSLGCRRWGKRWVYFAPVLWFTWEYLRGIGVMGFPWLNLAHTQTSVPLWIQFADIVGAHGVSLWAALCNGFVYWVIERYRAGRGWHLSAAILILWMGWPGLYGAWRMQHLPEVTGAVNVGVVQGNVDAAQRWSQLFKEANYRKYARLSLSLADENPAVIVWPESAALSYLQIDRLYRERFRALADSLHTPIFTGALDFENDSTETGHSYNAAFLIRPGGAPLERYAKRQLVPFGEHNPLERTFPILQQVDFGQANFTPGPEATIFSVPSLKLTGGGDRPARFGALICFESIFPKLTRSFRDGNIDFLVIITNDGWFGELAAPYQHAAIAVYRAIESRRPVARCANTGISLFIDQAGRISQPSPTYEEHAMVARLETTEAVTLYARYGDLAPRVVLLVAGLGLLTLLIPGRRNGSGNQSAV